MKDEMMTSPLPLEERTLEFAVRMTRLGKQVRKSVDFDIARQLIRSGTSIGANVHEAGAAFSKPDFAHKMSIARKEARESWYWLRVIQRLGYQSDELPPMVKEADELVRILTTIVKKTSPRP